MSETEHHGHVTEEPLPDVFARWTGAPELDDAFEAAVAAARDGGSAALDSDPWRD
ncbi:hypothetical protein GCM10010492_12470 [Saccharothrix mutabilis subsp. mutabilis]|uniref:Uncharacterized protein n=1 Tax=Saccharothrix mutabilis subsp. mutabilis TaxID=66855 RepID=A0ABP3CV74_9PSEU